MYIFLNTSAVVLQVGRTYNNVPYMQKKSRVYRVLLAFLRSIYHNIFLCPQILRFRASTAHRDRHEALEEPEEDETETEETLEP